MTIKAGSFVKVAVGDPDVGAIRVGIAVEVSTNKFADGTSESYAQVAWLPLEHVPLDTLTEYVSGGSAAVEQAPSGREVVESTSDVAAGLEPAKVAADVEGGA